jgi:phosphoglycolate phosphatase-like HAD superfamily hydrolase
MALAARVAPIGIAHGASTGEALRAAGAIAVVDRFADLEAVFGQLEEPLRQG